MFGRKKRKKAKKVKRDKNMRYWLITVGGYDQFYSPPYTAQTLALALHKSKTPLDWFADHPKAYSRFEFNANILYNFWEVTPEQYYSYYRRAEQEEIVDQDSAEKGGA